MKIVVISLFLILSVYGVNAQRAKEGNATISTANNIVNTYTYLTANASAGASSIIVNNNSMTGGAFGGSLAPGDLILIIQMQGAQVDMHPYPTTVWGGDYTAPLNYIFTYDWYEHKEAFGAIIDYHEAGNFEKAEVASTSGLTGITLQCPLQKTYTASGHVQVVRIPRYDNLTITGGPEAIIPTQWNGQTGGIVAIEVDNVLDIQAGSSISANGDGFRGGQVDPAGQAGNPADPNGVTFVGTSDPFDGSEKGESIGGFYTEYDALYSRYGTGACANGGGGGGFQNAGGGGGSNISLSGVPFTGNGVPDPAYAIYWARDFTHPPSPSPPGSGPVAYSALAGTSTPGGGRGGYALADKTAPYPNPSVTGPNNSAWAGDARKTNGGLGGFPLVYNAAKIYFGGGGGAGDQDSGQGGSGGRGGGMVFITNYGSIIGSGTIEVNGDAGQNSNPLGQSASYGNKKGNDAAGGGGGGGAIYIENATALPASLNLNAIGGNGGNQNTLCGFSGPPFNLWDKDECSGPGGSGAGGSIAYNSGAPTENVAAGSNGTHSTNHPSPMMSAFPPNGATNGSVGVGGLSALYFDLEALNDTICAGNTATLTATVSGSLPGTITWYVTPYGGSAIGTGASYTTPVLGVPTTYYVGVCPGGTFRIPVTVVIDPCALPVELVSFEVENENCTNTCTWKVNSEINCDFYTLEQSTDGIRWEEKQEIDAMGNAQQLLVYSATIMHNIGSERMYYRLSQTDIDGTRRVLGVREIDMNCLDDNGPAFYPNPFVNTLNVKVSEAAMLTIFDVDGRIVQRIAVDQGQTTLDVRHITNGVYLIQTEYLSGETFNTRLLK